MDLSLLVPRFPVPFLELLCEQTDWKTVLALVSVDKREAPMRFFWISERSIVDIGRLGGGAVARKSALAKLTTAWPRLVLQQTVKRQGVRISRLTALTRLVFDVNAPLKRVPPVEQLVFGDRFNQSLRRLTLPSNLRVVRFGGCFNRDLPVSWPDTVVELELGLMFSRELRVLPPRLERLKLGLDFKHRLSNTKLPATLQLIEFGSEYGEALGDPFDGVEWPLALRRVILVSKFFDGSLKSFVGLPNLKEIRLSTAYTALAQEPIPDAIESAVKIMW